MTAVSSVLITTIKELQSLSGLSQFALAGGTNLAYWYNHRKSIDIDLFCNNIIGRKGFKSIEKEIKKLYGKSIHGIDYPCNENDQYIFLRCVLSRPNGVTIKIEILQNMKTMYDIDVIDNIRLVSIKDIGLYKLVSVSNRLAKKDIYDLDYITDDIDIIELFNELKIKKEKFNTPTDKTIFDLDKESSPIDNPSLLLEFDEKIATTSTRPIHSSDLIDVMINKKSWNSARLGWRIKIRTQ